MGICRSLLLAVVVVVQPIQPVRWMLMHLSGGVLHLTPQVQGMIILALEIEYPALLMCCMNIGPNFYWPYDILHFPLGEYDYACSKNRCINIKTFWLCLYGQVNPFDILCCLFGGYDFTCSKSRLVISSSPSVFLFFFLASAWGWSKIQDFLLLL